MAHSLTPVAHKYQSDRPTERSRRVIALEDDWADYCSSPRDRQQGSKLFSLEKELRHHGRSMAFLAVRRATFRESSPAWTAHQQSKGAPQYCPFLPLTAAPSRSPSPPAGPTPAPSRPCWRLSTYASRPRTRRSGTARRAPSRPPSPSMSHSCISRTTDCHEP